MSEHSEYRDQVAAYALDALEPHEKLEVERHLAGCDGCREYLMWLHPAIDLLPASVEARTPPASLKRSLMGAVEAEIKADRRAEKARKRSERGLWGTIWRPVTAGVLGVVLIAGATVGWLLRGDNPQSEFFEVERLAQGGPAMEASLEVQGNEGILHVAELPALPPAKDYQAWVQHDGRMEPSSTFEIREDGEVHIDDLEGAEGVYITLEPEDGSEEPTEPILMGVELS
ncbi:MAG: anti-sigma factor [Actinomycetota bacterium]|nr:anti-sigma factor [Actinomycetota bacterium]